MSYTDDVMASIVENVTPVLNSDCVRWKGRVRGNNNAPVVAWHGVQVTVKRFLFNLANRTGKRLRDNEVLINTCGDHYCVNPDHHRRRTKAEVGRGLCKDYGFKSKR